MWLVIHMARTLALAQSICDRLTDEGFLVRLNPVYRGVCETKNYYELMVPRAEAEEARSVLAEHGIC